MYLVDTHVWLWMHAEPTRLGSRTRALLGDPTNPLFVSVASAWEIAIKSALGKLALGMPAASWWSSRLVAVGALELAVAGEHACAVEALPPLHRDPFDRLLVAQANCVGLQLVTADDVVLAYPGRFVDARH